jgi:hypothetical protein
MHHRDIWKIHYENYSAWPAGRTIADRVWNDRDYLHQQDQEKRDKQWRERINWWPRGETIVGWFLRSK